MAERYATSEEFAAGEPILTEEEATRLLEEHGLTFAEFKYDNTDALCQNTDYVHFDKIRTQLVLDWMGY